MGIYIYTGVSKMVLISANISIEQYEWKRKKGINWGYIIAKGIEAIDNSAAISELNANYEEMKAKQQRTAELLQKYAALASSIEKNS